MSFSEKIREYLDKADKHLDSDDKSAQIYDLFEDISKLFAENLSEGRKFVQEECSSEDTEKIAMFIPSIIEETQSEELLEDFKALSEKYPELKEELEAWLRDSPRKLEGYDEENEHGFFDSFKDFFSKHKKDKNE